MRGHLTKKGDRWYAVVDLTPGDNKKRRQKWIRLNGRTKRDADAGLAKILKEIADEVYVEKTKTTLAEHLDTWINMNAKGLAGKTLQRYRAIIESYLKPKLGSLSLTNLRPQRIQEAYAEWERCGNKKKGERYGTGLSAPSIIHIHHVLSGALKLALDWGLVARNVTDVVKVPKPAHHEMSTLDEDQVERLLDAAQGSRLHAPVYLALMTGMRRGELLALQWIDLDLDSGKLTIRRSLEELKGSLKFKSPKNGLSRTLHLGAATIAVLRKHKSEQNEERLFFGAQYAKGDLIFAGVRGEPWRPSTLTHGFGKLVARSGVPSVRLHDLRHSCASLMLAQGVDIQTISKRLGHSSAVTTLKVYAHSLDKAQEAAAQQLDDLITGAIERRRRNTGA